MTPGRHRRTAGWSGSVAKPGGHPDIPFDRLVFEPPPSRWIRFWRRFGPVRMFGPPPLRPDVPLNIDPRTGGLLGGLDQDPAGSWLQRLSDRVMWWTAHPDARFVLHDERLRRRRDSMAAWRSMRLRAALARRPAGQWHQVMRRIPAGFFR